ncbi:MAG: hypothetical protein RJA57_1250 [Bacteroidota bacterium]
MAWNEGLSRLPKKSYFHILIRSGHMGMLEEPEGSARILRSVVGKTVKSRLPI